MQCRDDLEQEGRKQIDILGAHSSRMIIGVWVTG